MPKKYLFTIRFCAAIADADFSASFAAKAMVSSDSFPSSVIIVASPILSRSSPRYISPSIIMCSAALTPSRRTRKYILPVSPGRPMFTKPMLILLEGETILKSQARARLSPAPVATPFIMAITGFEQFLMAEAIRSALAMFSV